ncbi:uncharacterized protein FA14DRAFT_161758 [Meira miltonrushii]|uniref:RRM domain-containing protein n=1 Tax=Meira miltonrushii TaxID=1280837 RepID=A0A316VB58_9BASI|nr:uncharacterized protein FA14DRAFT_161758 [Meira miltonrushii]PWN34328.1 hypothetical protein FA14DRAFT_161758 [Meira miltonrushii]
MSSSTVVEAVQDGLTNKEKRLARKAEKQAARKSGTKDDEKKRKQEDVVEEDVEISDKEHAEGEKADEEEEEEEDIEAVSHKERRKRRKMEKQAAKHGEQEEGQTGEVDAKANAESENKTVKDATQRSLFSLWVGNLSFKTSPTRLQEWFEQHELFGITRVYMPKGARKFEYNRGFAYVDVPSEEEVKQGIALSEVNLDGRRLLIKSGSDFGGRPTIDAAARALAEGNMAASTGEEHQQNELEGIIGKKGKTGLTKTAQKILRAQKHPPGPTLFIGNLSFNATEEGVRDMIERSAASRFEHESARASNIVSEKKKEAKKSAEDDEEEEAAESTAVENDVAEESKKETTGGKPELLRGAGIRKIRMGEFEDTGKCKGFAFVDFHTPSYATATLIDPRNGHLDGRELILQYAGAEAIRRGAPKGKMGERPQGQKRPYGERRQRPWKVEEERKKLAESAPEPGTFDIDQPLPKKHKETKEERIQRREAEKGDRKTTSTRRVRPGAALASAQRGKVAIDIDAPQGNKKTFGDDDDA